MNFYKKGERALNNKNYHEAIEYLSKSIKSWSKPAKKFSLAIVFNLRGIAYSELKEYNKAIEDFTEAIKLNPKYEEAFNNRGVAYYNSGEYDRAIEDYTEAIRLEKGYPQSLHNRGLAYLEIGEYDKAIEDFTKEVSLNPKSPEAYDLRGMAYLRMGLKEKALEDFVKALEINPEFWSSYLNRGLLYSEDGEYEKAIKDFTKAIDLNPLNAEIYNNRGIAYSELEEYEMAIMDFTQAVKFNPYYKEAYFNRGICYEKREEYQKAIEDFSEALRLNPDDAETLYRRGISYYHLGLIEKAILDLKRSAGLGHHPAKKFLKEKIKPIDHEVRVELVLIEVFVSDKKGNFIEDLTKDDFEVYEDGKKVKIHYFNVVKPAKELIEIKKSETIEEAKEPSAREKRLIILFDNINNNPLFLLRSLPEIEKMLKTLLEKTKEISIMELNPEYGVRIIQPFSSERSSILTQISEFKGDLWKEIEKQTSERTMKEIEKDAKLSIENRFMSSHHFFTESVILERSLAIRRRLERSFSAFLTAINYIRGFDGIKIVLLISDGFSVRSRIVKLFDPFEIFDGKKYFDSREVFDRFLKLINEENITFYTLSPKGLELTLDYGELPWGPGASQIFWKDEIQQWTGELYTIEKIAEETGGLYLRDKKKYEEFVKYLERDLTHFYEIAYKPLREEKDGKFHKVKIKVKRPDLIVRYKKGYMDFTEKELERRNIALAFLSPSFFRDITFSCKMNSLFLESEVPQFWMRLAIPLNQFQNFKDSPEELTVMFGIKEEKGEKFHIGETKLRVRDAIKKGSPFLYYAFGTSELKLKPGEYSGLIILRHGEDRIAGWEATLKIPELKREGHASILNSILGFIRSDISSDGAPFTISKRDGALNLSKANFFPLVDNEFREGSKIALFLQIYNPDESKDFSFRFSLYKDEELISNTFSQKIESYFDKKTKIFNEIYLLDFHGIFPGDYRLVIHSPQDRIEKVIKVRITP
ncbi:MAG: VWA domain-containing protein [Acidobacteriota bacterium]